MSSSPLLSRTALVLACSVVLASVLAWVPRPWGEGPILDVRPDFSGLGSGGPLPEEPPEAAPAVAEVVLPEPMDTTDGDAQHEAVVLALRELTAALGPATTRIERPCRQERDGVCAERAMDAFYGQLYEIARGTATEPAVWTQLGDSMTAWVDGPTAFRHLMQKQFGDAGIGAFLPGDPGHAREVQDVDRRASGWRVRTAPFRSDPQFGANGAVFRAGKTSVHSPTPIDHLGVLASGPGTVKLVMDGSERTLSLTEGLTSLDTPPLTDWTVDATGGDAPVVALLAERRTAGVRVDNLGVVSMRADHLLATEDDSWTRQIRAIDPDVLVFYYGAMTEHEDMAWHRRPPPEDWLAMYEARYRRVLARADQADADCLVLSMLTRAEPDASGRRMVIFDSVAPTVQAQRRAALAQGCAFFDGHAAIGGSEGANDWYWHEPRWLGFDLRHLTPEGYREYSRLLYISVIHGFNEWLNEGGATRTGRR